MSGYPYGGNPPQYPPPQNQIYPQIYNPANAPPVGHNVNLSYPGAPQYQQYPNGNQMVYPNAYPGQPLHPMQPGQPIQTAQPMQPGQPIQTAPPMLPGQQIQMAQPMQPGQQIQPGQGYPGMYIAPTPTAPYGFSYPTGTPQGQTVEWVPTMPKQAPSLSDRAVVAGYESWDNSPLWVIRARHGGDLIPGKLAVKHHAAYVPWDGKENTVQNIEVMCARPECIRWVEHKGGSPIPGNAIPGGSTASGETLYIGRAKEQGSLAPGKVHPSHKVLYISFAGQEIGHKSYEILCKV